MAPLIKVVIVPLTEVPREDVEELITRPLVLVVDDEPLVADTLAAILSKAGFDTVAVYGASAALALTKGVQPALLISDVYMPGMNGVELAMTLVKSSPACRVLLFSGHATTEDLKEARAAGYDFPLLTKPVHPVEIIAHVSRYLGSPAKPVIPQVPVFRAPARAIRHAM